LGDLTENQPAGLAGDLAARSEQAPVRVLDLRAGVRFISLYEITKLKTPAKLGLLVW